MEKGGNAFKSVKINKCNVCGILRKYCDEPIDYRVCVFFIFQSMKLI